MHVALGSWAILNFGTSLALKNNESAPYNKYFYHMNIYWNAVNATIAGFGLAGHARKDFNNYDLEKMKRDQRRIERLMLMNAGLDVLYIASGIVLKNYSDRFKKNPEMLEGYGTSMIFQGAFLLLFDNTYYLLYRSNRKRFSEMNTSVSISTNGFGIQMRF
jgi:hypothetical protein